MPNRRFYDGFLECSMLWVLNRLASGRACLCVMRYALSINHYPKHNSALSRKGQRDRFPLPLTA